MQMAATDRQCLLLLPTAYCLLIFRPIRRIDEALAYLQKGKPEVEGLNPSLGTNSKDELGGMKDERTIFNSLSSSFRLHPSSLFLGA
jgi:hypothetical protein